MNSNNNIPVYIVHNEEKPPIHIVQIQSANTSYNQLPILDLSTATTPTHQRPNIKLGTPGNCRRLDTITPNTSFLNQSINSVAGYDRTHDRSTSSITTTPAKASLRQFAQLVLHKVQEKGSTTYNEVADELVSEHGTSNEELNNHQSNQQTNSQLTPHSHHQAHFHPAPQPSENKNIRRRVYDALNVLMALNIIYKNKKQIHYLGIPNFNDMLKNLNCESVKTEKNDKNGVKTENQIDHSGADFDATITEPVNISENIEIIQAKQRIRAKKEHLYEILLQQIAFKNLVKRNQDLHEYDLEQYANRENLGSEVKCVEPVENDRLSLPFIVAVTSKNANVNCQYTRDEKDYVLGFDEPLEILDDVDVLRAMGLTHKFYVPSEGKTKSNEEGDVDSRSDSRSDSKSVSNKRNSSCSPEKYDVSEKRVKPDETDLYEAKKILPQSTRVFLDDLKAEIDNH